MRRSLICQVETLQFQCSGDEEIGWLLWDKINFHFPGVSSLVFKGYKFCSYYAPIGVQLNQVTKLTVDMTDVEDSGDHLFCWINDETKQLFPNLSSLTFVGLEGYQICYLQDMCKSIHFVNCIWEYPPKKWNSTSEELADISFTNCRHVINLDTREVCCVWKSNSDSLICQSCK